MNTRWNKKNVLIFAGLLGLTAGLLVQLQMGRSAEPPSQLVAVANVLVKKGDRIEASSVVSKSVTVADAQRQALVRPEDVVDMQAKRDLRPGRLISKLDVGPWKMSTAIAPGMRAVAVAVDPVISVAGFLKPGDHVDVVATYNQSEGSVSRTILHDVLLLAIGPEVKMRSGEEQTRQEGPTSGTNTVTLSASPADAEKLVLAENQGRLRLVLRGDGDRIPVATLGASMPRRARASVAPGRSGDNPGPNTANPPWPVPDGQKDDKLVVQKPVVEVWYGDQQKTFFVSQGATAAKGTR